jgi:hypothetical protein
MRLAAAAVSATAPPDTSATTLVVVQVRQTLQQTGAAGAMSEYRCASDAARLCQSLNMATSLAAEQAA